MSPPQIQPNQPFRQLWNSVGFRLAFTYGLLVTLTMLATISILYLQTVGVMYQGISRQVTNESLKLVTRFEKEGATALIRDIERAIADEQNASTELYLYLSPTGLRLAGNIDEPPHVTSLLYSGHTVEVRREGHSAPSFVLLRALSDDSQLFVGHDLHDQEEVDSLVTRGITIAAAVAVLLLLGGLFLFRLELERSVESIRKTLMRVSGGELQVRVQHPGQEDEFALLGRDINQMLDRIETLMDGVRHISDTIAHNLRTPLTRILLRLRQAALEQAPDSAQRQELESAVQEIEELITVFEKLLQISEAEAGARRIEFAPVDMRRIVDDVVDLYGPVAEAQESLLLMDRMDYGLVLGDPDLMASALSNLIENALKYGGSGCVVRVQCVTARDQIKVSVTDNGPGIPPDKLPQIGTRFFRVHRQAKGHGLGLASVTAIVSLHGGRMRYVDAQPGLRVTLELPLHRA